MTRECTLCRRPFGAEDLCRTHTKGMEAERKAAGLEGVRFLYFHCPACGMDDILVGVLPLPGESREDFVERRDALEAAVRRLHEEPARADAVVVAVEG